MKSAKMPPLFNKTFIKVIENIAFGSLSPEILTKLFKDGRIFSHFAEQIIAQDFSLTHVTGCKGHDLVEPTDINIKYEQKTFTEGGCNFMPSNMIGQGGQFDKAVFTEKSKNLIYAIVSNIKFPEIKIRFVKGEELAQKYPSGKIPLKDHDNFFKDE